MTMSTQGFREICPFKIGSKVTIKPENQYAKDYPGVWTVVMLAWDYNEGDGTEINIAIASPDDIEHRRGWTDGWRVGDLLPAA